MSSTGFTFTSPAVNLIAQTRVAGVYTSTVLEQIPASQGQGHLVLNNAPTRSFADLTDTFAPALDLGSNTSATTIFTGAYGGYNIGDAMLARSSRPIDDCVGLSPRSRYTRSTSRLAAPPGDAGETSQAGAPAPVAAREQIFGGVVGRLRVARLSSSPKGYAATTSIGHTLGVQLEPLVWEVRQPAKQVRGASARASQREQQASTSGFAS